MHIHDMAAFNWHDLAMNDILLYHYQAESTALIPSSHLNGGQNYHRVKQRTNKKKVPYLIAWI